MTIKLTTTTERGKKEKAVKLAKDCWGEKNVYKVFKVYEIRILMIDEEELEKRQNKVLEIIKDYIKPSLLSKTWNTDGIIVTNISNNF